MGKHPILTSVHAPKQVPGVMGFVHHENGADLCATNVREFAYASIMELVLSHNESRCIHYQHSCMIVERRTTLYDQTIAGRLNLFKKIPYADSTECIERELIALLLCWMLWALFTKKYNADLSSAHVKDIAHHSPVKLVLFHQESRCICYQYFSHDWGMIITWLCGFWREMTSFIPWQRA